MMKGMSHQRWSTAESLMILVRKRKALNLTGEGKGEGEVGVMLVALEYW